MTNQDNQYQHKARYNLNHETYVNDDGTTLDSSLCSMRWMPQITAVLTQITTIPTKSSKLKRKTTVPIAETVCYLLEKMSFQFRREPSHTTFGVARRNTVSVMHCQAGDFHARKGAFLCGVLIIFIGF